MKRFLLIAGENYYPCSGTEDWVAAFETKEEAETWIRTDEKGKTQVKHRYNWKGASEWNQVDWYEIVDLQEVMNGKASFIR